MTGVDSYIKFEKVKLVHVHVRDSFLSHHGTFITCTSHGDVNIACIDGPYMISRIGYRGQVHVLNRHVTDWPTRCWADPQPAARPGPAGQSVIQFNYLLLTD